MKGNQLSSLLSDLRIQRNGAPNLHDRPSLQRATSRPEFASLQGRRCIQPSGLLS